MLYIILRTHARAVQIRRALARKISYHDILRVCVKITSAVQCRSGYDMVMTHDDGDVLFVLAVCAADKINKISHR